MIRHTIICAATAASLALCAPVLAQKLYKVIDEKGNISYQDKPPVQEKVEVQVQEKHIDQKVMKLRESAPEGGSPTYAETESKNQSSSKTPRFVQKMNDHRENVEKAAKIPDNLLAPGSGLPQPEAPPRDQPRMTKSADQPAKTEKAEKTEEKEKNMALTPEQLKEIARQAAN